MTLQENYPFLGLSSPIRCDMLTSNAEINLFFAASEWDAGVFHDLAGAGRFRYRLGDYIGCIAHLDI